MRLIYLTSKKYPGNTADHHYVENLARAFNVILKDDLTLIVCNTDKNSLPSIHIISLDVPIFVKRTLFFFFWTPWYWFSSLRKRDSNKDSQIIFFSNDQNLLFLLIFWKRLLHLPFMITADWHMLSKKWKDKYIAKHSDYSISTSYKLESAIRMFSTNANVHTVYGGVDLNHYKKRSIDLVYQQTDKKVLRKKLNLPADKFLIGYVGLFKTIGMEKGISTMIQALSSLDDDCIMVFVGGKPDEIKYYEKQAQSCNVLYRCVFLSMQTFDKVVEYEKAMDILVIPYPDKPHFRDYGFPMKVYEYMASGVPIIYTKLELLEEIISDCAYGVKPDSPDALAKMISFIRSHADEAKKLSNKALNKVATYTWQSKASNILNIIMNNTIAQKILIIPNKALKYILFQRTEFSIYAHNRWILRFVMNKHFPIYNSAVKFEAIFFKDRTKRLFSLDMEKEFYIIKDFLPENPKNILDIGCGVAGIDIMLFKRYSRENKSPNFHLLDRTEINQKVYYGLEKTAAYYNSLVTAKDLLMANGVSESHIHTQEVTGAPIFPEKKFGLIISLISWGFHYPVSAYLDQVYNLLIDGGVLIMDVRKDTDGLSFLERKFGYCKVIYEAKKYRRVFIQKGFL